MLVVSFKLKLVYSAIWHHSYLRESRILVFLVLMLTFCLIPHYYITTLVLVIVLARRRRKIVAPLARAARLPTGSCSIGIAQLGLQCPVHMLPARPWCKHTQRLLSSCNRQTFSVPHKAYHLLAWSKSFAALQI